MAEATDITGPTVNYEGHTFPDLQLHWYHGLAMNEDKFSTEMLDKVKNMKLKAGDILLQSYPKSGSTWLQHLVWLLHNGIEAQTQDQRTVWARMPLLELDCVGPIPCGVDMAEKMPSPRILKTHLPSSFFEKQIDDTECKCIVIVRNPKDLLVSYYHFHKIIYPHLTFGWDTMFEMFKAKYMPYSNWDENVASWTKHMGDAKYLFLTYEEMKRDTPTVIRTVAEFMETPCDDETVKKLDELISFETMSKDPKTNLKGSKLLPEVEGTNFMRKGVVGDWQNYFTGEQSQYVDELVARNKSALAIPIVYEL